MFIVFFFNFSGLVRSFHQKADLQTLQNVTFFFLFCYFTLQFLQPFFSLFFWLSPILLKTVFFSCILCHFVSRYKNWKKKNRFNPFIYAFVFFFFFLLLLFFIVVVFCCFLNQLTFFLAFFLLFFFETGINWGESGATELSGREISVA